MNTALLVARLLLAGVIAVAGTAKLADRKGSRQAMIDFGLPSSLAGPLGLLLPVAELAVAADPTATASARSTPPRPVGKPLSATGCSPPWPPCWSGRGGAATQARAPSAGSEPSRLSNSWFSSVDWSSSVSWRASGGSCSTFSGRTGACSCASRRWRTASARATRRHLTGTPPRANRQRDFRSGPLPNCGKAHPGGGAGRQPVPAARKIGEPAPEVELPALDGATIRLSDFRGEETLVLFWNPGCGFCQRLLPDLKQWEESRPEEAPELLVISAGTRRRQSRRWGSPPRLCSTRASRPGVRSGRAARHPGSWWTPRGR
jgi:hypothetical protein